MSLLSYYMTLPSGPPPVLLLRSAAYSGSGQWLDASGFGRHVDLTGITYDGVMNSGASSKMYGKNPLSANNNPFEIRITFKTTSTTAYQCLWETYDAAGTGKGGHMFIANGTGLLFNPSNISGPVFANIFQVGVEHTLTIQHDGINLFRILVDGVVKGTHTQAIPAAFLSGSYPNLHLCSRNGTLGLIGYIRNYEVYS